MASQEQGRTAVVIGAIWRERARQEQLKAEGRFRFTLADDGMTDDQRLTCIMEEVGEVARNVLARGPGLVRDGDPSDAALYKELSQVAALCAAWMERL